MTIPFLYQLQNADYRSLSAADFQIGVIDPDDSELTAAEVASLQQAGKTVYAYTSIGEAEDYRDYWSSSWKESLPDFLLSENAAWEGNFRVKFWDQEWQKIILGRIDDAVAKGYDGVYLDIVDGYTVSEVIEAYPGSQAQLRQEMIDFVLEISAHAKLAQPGFAVLPQNAVGLLSLQDSDPDSGANTAYLDAIDGLGVEDLWYDGNSSSDWTQGDLDLIALAQRAGKFVLATSYPAQDEKQVDFIEKALAAGLVPFVTDRDLTGVIDPDNPDITDATPDPGPTAPPGEPDDTAPESDDKVLDGSGGNDTINGGEGVDLISGGAGEDVLSGEGAADVIIGGSGDDRIFGNQGDDRLVGSDGADLVKGGDGNDTVLGASGQDRLVGGSGDDVLRGGDGHDRLFGNAGKDRLTGGLGDDELVGGGGDDELFGNEGNDRLIGGWGHDRLRGNAGDDKIVGNAGDDILAGGSGNDLLRGGGGTDRLLGNQGKDRLLGGNGNDWLNGGDGGDRLEGGRGNDVLFGGDDADHFVFAPSGGQDVVRDFDITEDVILAQGLTLVDSYERHGKLVLDFGENTEVTLVGLTLADLGDIDIMLF